MITAIFEVPGMTAAHYDTVIERLIAAGAGQPDGRVSHAASATEDGWLVVDVWESGEQLNAFAGAYLGPTLADVVGDVPDPVIRPTHAFVAG